MLLIAQSFNEYQRRNQSVLFYFRVLHNSSDVVADRNRRNVLRVKRQLKLPFKKRGEVRKIFVLDDNR